jgi:hypothetical protein
MAILTRCVTVEMPWMGVCRKLEKKLLQRHNDELKDDVASMGFHQKDVYVYIHEKLDEYSAQVAEYQAEIATLKDDAERLRASTQTEIEEATERLQLENAELREERQKHTDELSDLQEFRSAMPEHKALVQSLEEDLTKERAAREQDKADMERKKIAEKQRLKTEMLKRVQEAKESILAETVQNLHDTTKRTLAENEQMTTELAYQSKSVTELLTTFANVERQRDSLRRQLQLCESQNEVQLDMFHKENTKLKSRIQGLEQIVKTLHQTARRAPGGVPSLAALTAAAGGRGLSVPVAALAAGGGITAHSALRPTSPLTASAAARGAGGRGRRATASAGAPRAAKPASSGRSESKDAAGAGGQLPANTAGSAALQRAKQRTRAWERRYVDASAGMRRAVASRDALVGALGEGMVVLAGVLQAPVPHEGSVPAPGLRGLSAARLLDAVDEVSQRRGADAALAVLVGGLREALDAAQTAEEQHAASAAAMQPPGGSGADWGEAQHHSLLVRSVLGDPVAADDTAITEPADSASQASHPNGSSTGILGAGGGHWSDSGSHLEQPSLHTLASVSDTDGGFATASAASVPSGSTAAALHQGRTAAAAVAASASVAAPVSASGTESSGQGGRGFGNRSARAPSGAVSLSRGGRVSGSQPHGVVRLFGSQRPVASSRQQPIASPSIAALGALTPHRALAVASGSGSGGLVDNPAAGSADTIPESEAAAGASASIASMAHASVPQLRPHAPSASPAAVPGDKRRHRRPQR